MKRPRSPSPGRSGLFSTDSKSVPEKKQQAELNEVIETKPYFSGNDSYVIRKIKLAEKPGSLIMELDRSLDPEETGILRAALSHLNDMLERAPLYLRKSRLTIKLRSNPRDDYLITVTAAKKEDMISFLEYLKDEHYISKATAIRAESLFEKSFEFSSTLAVTK